MTTLGTRLEINHLLIIIICNYFNELVSSFLLSHPFSFKCQIYRIQSEN